jgi:hypothetical protein
MFYSVTQSFLNFLRILNRVEVCVARVVKLESPYIESPRNHSLTYRKKNCRRGDSRSRLTISRMLKYFAAKVYTTFFVQSKICNYYKTNKLNLLHWIFQNYFKFHKIQNSYWNLPVSK